MKTVRIEPNLESWRAAARSVLAQDLGPDEVFWNDEVGTQAALFGEDLAPAPEKRVFVPREFGDLAELVACHRSPERWNLLYRLLYRLTHGEKDLLKISVDPDVHRALAWKKSITKDIHKMHAFVRFKSVATEDGGERFVAWHQPEHLVVRLATPFFARRFGDRPWTIFTPDETANWDLKELFFTPGIPAHEFQNVDFLDELWRSYYKSIYNPARLNMKMMRQEMSPKYWSSLPEAQLFNELMRQAPSRLQKMAANQNVSAEVKGETIPEMRAEARDCRACPLFGPATQTVFGEGPEGARLMIVGEQPGHEEDLAGRPFVGPAGAVLDQALEAAGVTRAEVYVTNAVKHFKFEDRGKTRLHKKPSGRESQACRPWLDAEVGRVRPTIIVALGTTAGTSILGRLPKITEERGRVQKSRRFDADVILSWHPAAILRASGPAEQERRLAELKNDLALAARLLNAPALDPAEQ